MQAIVQHEINKLGNVNLFSPKNKIIYTRLPQLYRYQNLRTFSNNQSSFVSRNKVPSLETSFVPARSFPDHNLGEAPFEFLNRSMNSRERAEHMQKIIPGFKQGLLDSVGFSKSDLTLHDGEPSPDSTGVNTAATTPRTSISTQNGSWDDYDLRLTHSFNSLSTHKSEQVNYLPPIKEDKEIQVSPPAKETVSSETQTDPLAKGLPYNKTATKSWSSRRVEPGAFHDYMRPTVSSLSKYSHQFKPAGYRMNT